LLTELLPFIQTYYRIDPTNLGVGGVDLGAVAAAHAALMNPVVFERLVMISPPLGKGPFEAQLGTLLRRFEHQERLPQRVFQSVGRHEAAARFVNPARALADILEQRAAQRETEYRFIEPGTGHGLVGYRAALPEALAWAFPGLASVPLLPTT
jgi:predicted alpha/beta superfamily hydrolase